MERLNTSLTQAIGGDEFTPEVVISALDERRCTPVSYRPNTAFSVSAAAAAGSPKTVEVPMELARYGLQIVRVYAPKDTTGVLSVIEALTLPDPDASMTVEHGGRVYSVDGGDDRYTVDTSDPEVSRCRRVRRAVHRIQEMLSFSGETEKTVKYWYDVDSEWGFGEPAVGIVTATDFYDANGRKARPPNNWRLGEVGRAATVLPGETAKWQGKRFWATQPVWGSMIVEYETEYDEWEFLYDFAHPNRLMELASVTAKTGTIVRQGGEVLEDNTTDKQYNVGKDRGCQRDPLNIVFKTNPRLIEGSDDRYQRPHLVVLNWTPPPPNIQSDPEKHAARSHLLKEVTRVTIPVVNNSVTVDVIDRVAFMDGSDGEIRTESVVDSAAGLAASA
jgi:hypothetical protein